MPSMIAIPRPVLSIAATREPLSPGEAKKQLEIADSDTSHDSYIASLIAMARERVEHDTGIVTLSSTWVLKLDCWPADEVIVLPLRPLSSVTSITYLDTAGSSQTLSSSLYEADSARVQPVIWKAYNQTWPALQGSQNAVTVTFVAGYANPASIPDLLRHAVKLALAQEFEDRTGSNAKAGSSDAYERIVSRLSRASYP